MAETSLAPVIERCQTSCDDDCEAPCHESHEVLSRRHHDADECEAGQRRWAEQCAELERARVLLSFAAGDGSQPYYPGTPAFAAWQKTEAERDALQEQLTFDSKRVYNAQVRAEKLSDTIDRVRTTLVDFGRLDKSNQTTALEVLEKIDEIIDGEEDDEQPA